MVVNVMAIGRFTNKAYQQSDDICGGSGFLADAKSNSEVVWSE